MVGDGSTKTMKDGLDGWLMVVILVLLFSRSYWLAAGKLDLESKSVRICRIFQEEHQWCLAVYGNF